MLELTRLVRVRVDREEAADLHGAPGALHGEVQAMGRAVHLQHGAGPRGLGIHDVPVEIQVIAPVDHPARRVGDDIDMRTADAVERPHRQLRPGLAAGDVDGGDDEIEAREQVILVVERAVGADLQLTAVEQPKALRRRLGRCRAGGLLRRKAGVERGDDRPLLLHPLRRQAVGDRQTL